MARKHPSLLVGVLDDLKALPSDELRQVALRLLIEIEAGKIVGKPLSDFARTGDLTDCFKIYFDLPTDGPPTYRIVYRLNPDHSITAAHIQAVAVGRRHALEVYLSAAHRLGR